MLCSPLEPAEGASQFHSAVLSWIAGPRPCVHDPPLPWFIGRWGSDLLGREILEIIHNLFPLDEREVGGGGRMLGMGCGSDHSEADTNDREGWMLRIN